MSKNELNIKLIPGQYFILTRINACYNCKCKYLGDRSYDCYLKFIELDSEGKCKSYEEKKKRSL